MGWLILIMWTGTHLSIGVNHNYTYNRYMCLCSCAVFMDKWSSLEEEQAWASTWIRLLWCWLEQEFSFPLEWGQGFCVLLHALSVILSHWSYCHCDGLNISVSRSIPGTYNLQCNIWMYVYDAIPSCSSKTGTHIM